MACWDILSTGTGNPNISIYMPLLTPPIRNVPFFLQPPYMSRHYVTQKVYMEKSNTLRRPSERMDTVQWSFIEPSTPKCTSH
jgi:hypothetical protein